jgi:hypothetical protein
MFLFNRFDESARLLPGKRSKMTVLFIPAFFRKNLPLFSRRRFPGRNGGNGFLAAPEASVPCLSCSPGKSVEPGIRLYASSAPPLARTFRRTASLSFSFRAVCGMGAGAMAQSPALLFADCFNSSII